MQSKIQPEKKISAELPPDPRKFVWKFLLVWLSSLVVVAAVTLLSDINWARAQIERQLGHYLDRQVKLGRLTWCLGLNGIQIETKSLQLNELSDEPFMSAGRTEIGISVLGLLSRKLVVKHLDFDDPAFRLVKTGPDSWNFDDLLKPGPEIRLIQIQNGTVLLLDSTSKTGIEALPAEIELTDLALKFNWPAKRKQLPFFLSMNLPRDGRIAHIELSGFSKGELSDWHQAQLKFSVKGNDFHPRDLEDIKNLLELPSEDPRSGSTIIKSTKPDTVAEAENLPHGIEEIAKQMDGLFHFSVEGEGSLAGGIKASINMSAKDLTLANDIFGRINAGHPDGQVDLSINENEIAWKDFLLRLHGLEIRSSGQLHDWNAADAKINAHVASTIANLKSLDGFIEKIGHDSINHFSAQSFITAIDPAQLTGSAIIDVVVTGTTRNTRLETKVKTNDLSIKDLLRDASKRLPILCIAGVTSESKITGDIRVTDVERIELINGQLSSPSAKIKAKGFVDLARDKASIDFDADDISLKDTAISLGQNSEALTQLTGSIRLPGDNKFKMSGFADAKGNLSASRNSHSMLVTMLLRNAGFSVDGNALSLDKVRGIIEARTTDGKGAIAIKNMEGMMGSGEFQLHGEVELRREPRFDLEFHATSFDLKHLSALLNMFQFQVPVLTESQLYGKVKDVRLKVSGPAFAPAIYFSAVPDNLFYKPPGLDKPLRATSGQIVYDRDELVLTEVAMVSQGNVIQTSLSIEDVTGECVLKRVKAKTVGIDLADVHYYLSSPAMPPPLQKAYLEILEEYHLKNPQGKAYGDILCLIHGPDDLELDGVIGCYGTRVLLSGFPITNLSGIFAASGDDLLLQDISGVMRDSRFSLEGHIHNYRTKDPTWRAELTARLAPREIIEMLPKVTEQLKTAKINVSTEGPLALRAKVHGSFKSNKVQFALIASENDRVRIDAPFGSLHQPAGMPLTFDGDVTVDSSSITIGETHLLLGETLLLADGKIIFGKGESYFPVKPGKNAKESDERLERRLPRDSRIVLNFKAPQKTPVETLVSLVNPALSKGMTGSLQGAFTIRGRLSNPSLHGKVDFDKISMPSFGIKAMTGSIKGGKKVKRIRVSENATATGQPDKQEDNESWSATWQRRRWNRPDWTKFQLKETAEAVLEINSMNVRDLEIKKLSTQLDFKTPDENVDLPRLAMTNGEAEFAEGRINFDGWMDFNDGALYTKATVEDTNANLIVSKLTGQNDEISGTASAVMELQTKGEEPAEMLNNLTGYVDLKIKEGIIARFGHLQTRLTQYNLITQGIFGFNFNNLLQSVWPVRTGEFELLTNRLEIAKGKIKIADMRYKGHDMRVWGSGHADVIKGVLEIEVAGRIPRVTQSMLGGTLGSLSRNMTLQKFMKVVTFGKLENLPSLPVLGAIATDKPRSFTFDIKGDMKKPEQVSRNIEKSFRWLPTRPTATAHPLPGLEFKSDY